MRYFFQCYDVKHNMIVTQAPMQNTMEEFWRVVMDNNVKCIVMLCPLKFDDAEYCAEYWPINDCMEIGEIKINNDATQEHDGFVETTLLLSENLVDKTPIKVTFLRHLGVGKR
uniref:Tyrosine-protein phosphatase domain-containing protein n=1 Tax=Ciona savignyi TaxID=51511 RepID=H2YJL2_CIOSA